MGQDAGIHQTRVHLSARSSASLNDLSKYTYGHTAKAVIVFSVFGLISAGMKARMKLGTLEKCVVGGRDMISVRDRI